MIAIRIPSSRVLLAFAAFAILAAPSFGLAVDSDDVTNFGAREVTKEELIDALRVDKKPLTRGIHVEPVERAISMQVNFEFDSYDLTESARNQLDVLAEALASDELGNAEFLLEGHTDAAGPDDYNLQLSERRADAVRDYLLGQSPLDSGRVRAEGKGEAGLLKPDDPLAAENRRVQVVSRPVE